MNELTGEQRRLLQGMGYTLLRRTNAPSFGIAESRDEPVQITPDSDRTSPSASASPALWTQILRALGGPAEVAGLFLAESGPALQFDGPRLGINLQALREDPQAKRRLWHVLRAVRGE